MFGPGIEQRGLVKAFHTSLTGDKHDPPYNSDTEISRRSSQTNRIFLPLGTTEVDIDPKAREHRAPERHFDVIQYFEKTRRRVSKGARNYFGSQSGEPK